MTESSIFLGLLKIGVGPETLDGCLYVCTIVLKRLYNDRDHQTEYTCTAVERKMQVQQTD